MGGSHQNTMLRGYKELGMTSVKWSSRRSKICGLRIAPMCLSAQQPCIDPADDDKAPKSPRVSFVPALFYAMDVTQNGCSRSDNLCGSSTMSQIRVDRCPPHRQLTGPSLTELLADPMVQLVMQRDGVTSNDILILFDRLQRRKRCVSESPRSDVRSWAHTGHT
jgi:hypothetical protein